MLAAPQRITAPVVLISQIPRSGGTLLMRALDGHPQVWSVPHEWGTRFLSRLSEDPWTQLFDTKILERNEHGFRQAKSTLNGETRTFEMDLAPDEQERLFHAALADEQAPSTRDVYDAYMSAYFGAWRNYANRDGEKRWISVFTPRLLIVPAKIDSFFEVYPDGRLVSVLRDPASWYASAQEWAGNEVGRPEAAAKRWSRATRCLLKYSERYGESVHVLSFERLVADPKAELSRLAGLLGIDDAPSLLEPTFNGEPILANSSFPVEQEGIFDAPARRSERLSAEERASIEAHTAKLYEQALALTR